MCPSQTHIETFSSTNKMLGLKVSFNKCKILESTKGWGELSQSMSQVSPVSFIPILDYFPELHDLFFFLILYKPFMKPILFFLQQCQVLVTAPGSSIFVAGSLFMECRTFQLRHVGSSSLTGDRTQTPCIGRAESQPLDHQGCPNIFKT